MKFIFLQFCFFTLSGCDSESPIHKRRIGNAIVEGRFSERGVNGEAKLYDTTGVLISKAFYLDNVLNGPSLTYYSNGKVKDSTLYSQGFKNGFEYLYSKAEKLVAVNYYYHGVRMGPETQYGPNVKEYFFTDFCKEDLINCTYDSLGNVSMLNGFSFGTKMERVFRDSIPLINLLFFLPSPPSLNVTYTLALENSEKKLRILDTLNTQQVFIDTLINLPEKDHKYVLIAKFNNESLKVNRIFMEEIVLNN